MNFDELLRLEGSALGPILRAALAGLAQTLHTAREQADPCDPGQAACERLIQELRTLIGAAPACPALPAAAALPSSAWVPATEDFGLPALPALRQEFLAAPEVRAELGDIDLPGPGPAELWQQLHLALLRLPAAAAATWREGLLRAAGPAANPAAAACVELPWDGEELVYPGLGSPPLARGLRLCPAAPLDPRLGAPPTSGTALTLARVVSVVLWYADAEPALFHALRSVYRFGMTALQGAQKTRYQNALVERFQRLREAEAQHEVHAVMDAWLDLDEAIHSLLHAPPASASSWWARVQRRGRDTMAEAREAVFAAGHQVFLRVLSGKYADVRQYADCEDQQVNGNVPPGDVVACLRVYARLDGNTLPGRVFYRAR